MSTRSDHEFLLDMLEAIRRADIYMNDMSYEEFVTDEKTQDAVIRTLEILGEASKSVSLAIKSRSPDIPWKNMAGLRDKLIHNYFGINLDTVWQVVTVELPKGWIEAKLEQLCDFNPRHNSLIDRQTAVSFVPMPAVCAQEGIILPHETRLLEEVWKGYTHFQDSDVIFAKITPCMENGKIAVVSGLHNGLACGSTEFHVLRSLGTVLPEYLWRFIRQVNFRIEAERHMTGAVGQLRVPVQFLKEINLPLPPLNEQRRIVAKLESLFTRSRRAREELERIPKLCDRYKQAVLAAAFRGDLTADWREKSGRLREKWEDKPFDALISSYQNGLSKRAGNDGKETTVLRLSDINDFKPNLHNPRKIKLTNQEAEKYALQKGDILVVRVNGSKDIVGRLILISEELNVAYCDHFIRLRLTSDCDPSWLSHYGNDESFRKYIFENMVSSAGQNTVSQGTLKEYSVALPSLDEQKEIVIRIETAFAHIDKLAAETTRAATLLDRLDQATLSKAFKGELVPQNPDDEPASALLERILAEKQTLPITKHNRNKKRA